MSKLIRCLCFCISCLAILPAESGHADTTTLNVGALLCATGACADVGQAALEGATLAVEEINARGGLLGRQLSIVAEDSMDGDSPANAVTAFKKLSNTEELFFIVGPTWSPAGMPLVPLLRSRQDLIVVSPSLGVREFNEGSDNILNLWPHDEVSASGLAALAIRHGWMRAAVVSGQDPWATAQAKYFSQAFERLGGKVVCTVEPLPSQTDLRPEMARIIQARPDAVMFTLVPHMAPGARLLRDFHFSGQMLSVQMTPAWAKAANGALDGTIFAGFSSSTGDFVQKFSRRFGHAPGMSADTGYDSIVLLKRAAERVGSLEPAALLGAMLKDSWDGASGTIRFDAHGGVEKEPRFFKISGERFDPF